MAKFSSLLSLRLKQKDSQAPKMTALAERSNNGSLSGFSGIFQVAPLNDKEKGILSDILKNFQEYEGYDSQQDLKDLIHLTSEVKAITNQAVMLHGERIKRAQTILKNYKEGAFTAWLIATYGNRQTPYNFLQYYEFCSQIPKELHQIIDEMPRQAIYTLASRAGAIEQKVNLVKSYSGESKQEILNIIRKEFPLDRDDKRLPNIANQSISSLARLRDLFAHNLFNPNEKQKTKILQLLEELHQLMKKHNDYE
jgi:hypothetical protein